MVGQGMATDNMTAIMDVSYDISTCTDFGQPDEFFKEKWYLQGLIKEAKERAIERAKQLDAEAYDMKSGDKTCAPPSTLKTNANTQPVCIPQSVETKKGIAWRKSISKGWGVVRSILELYPGLPIIGWHFGPIVMGVEERMDVWQKLGTQTNPACSGTTKTRTR
ncbi:hypothetical protein BDN72DRAFT_865822 [Pluteus cervinus]|uniref:Uncharacterized protein n=1 Tax=Pluteus cervinus TaxID=181527 RepID=A0ACD2ZYQ7_9AGAR|nr:hypothetical protein BDN72DRAFT_865822 [Pluteus cervinus]